MYVQLAAEIFIPVHFVMEDEQLQRFLLDYFFYDTDPEFSMHEIIQDMRSEQNSNVYDRGDDFGSTLFSLSDDILCLYRMSVDAGEYEVLEKYCIKKSIPFDRKTCSNGMELEVPIMTYYRPGMHMPMEVKVDSAYSPLIEPSFIIQMINNAPENESDIDVLLRLSEYIEDISFNSGQMALSNWTENQI